MSVIAAPSVRLDEATHKYYLGDRRLRSVSSVIKQMLPIKKSFDGVNPAVIENARDRGILTDKYCCEYVRTGDVELPANEREDVRDNVKLFVNWWDQQDNDLLVASTQRILVDPARDIAGTADLVLEDAIIDSGSWIYDIKCTSKEEVDWEYQLGAYAFMLGRPSELAIIHINPKKYKEGMRILKYDPERAIGKWTTLLAFWKDCAPYLKEQDIEK